ncbi:hypothetical protein [Flavobacterium sp. C4GT6]|uniref:hypothetical protein n=1 Tax=Flavobacterium sp. C4GT6 TaxID=3103818 RepID=UPI002ED5B885
MKKLLLLLLLVPLTAFNGSGESDVYICTGKSSKRYHYNKNCRGLSNCKAEIKEVTLKEAKDKGRTLCGYED